jgi:outer membrane biosynthesis protein TonB
MNTIELIVSETGSVERVRLLSTPKRMPDMMLLSGAKNWVFEPALKDGQSVRYRLELSWAATP